MAYDSSNIKIKHHASEPWEASIALAERYKRDPAWIQRSLEACRLCNVPFSYFIERYLEKNNSVPLIPEVSEVSRQLQIEFRNK